MHHSIPTCATSTIRTANDLVMKHPQAKATKNQREQPGIEISAFLPKRRTLEAQLRQTRTLGAYLPTA